MDATSRYLAALTVLDDADLRAPSLLPGWSRAHVVTHLSRNADGLARLLAAARTGSEETMYESQARRDADIEAGASRSAAELRTDAETSEERYQEAVSQMTPTAWEVQVRRVPGAEPFPVSEVPRMRRTEIEVHHADLGIGYTARDWPPDFTAAVVPAHAGHLAAR